MYPHSSFLLAQLVVDSLNEAANRPPRPKLVTPKRPSRIRIALARAFRTPAPQVAPARKTLTVPTPRSAPCVNC